MLAIGLVVDDAIVVVEAAQVNIERGMKPRAAALEAMRNVASPIVATTVVLLAVFIPDVVHGRHHGAAVPAVLGDDRRVGGASRRSTP